MARIGLSPDELAATWSPSALRYAAHVPGLDVLAGETLALVGEGTGALLGELAEALGERVAAVDGRAAARGGALRIRAQEAARAGARGLAVAGPVDRGLAEAGRALAVADLAGLRDLGLTTAVEVEDVTLGALFADRVVVVAAGRPVVAYPVVTPVPRLPDDVLPVVDRVDARLAALA